MTLPERGLGLYMQHSSRFEIQSLPILEPSPKSVLLRVLASGLNHFDLDCGPDFPSGSDCCGVIEAVGEDVNHWSLGTRVVVDPILVCHSCRWCARKLYGDCPNLKILGQGVPGAHASFVEVPSRNIHRAPANLSAAEVAAMPVALTSIYRALQQSGTVTQKMIVLVTGATGSVGAAALQMIKLAGARVFATTRQPERANELRDLGADRVFVIDSEEQADLEDRVGTNHDFWVQDILKATGQRGVDVVVDTLGAAFWPSYFALLTRHGEVLTCGTLAGQGADFDLTSVQQKQLRIRGFGFGQHSDLSKVLALVSLADIRLLVDSEFEFQDFEQAFERLAVRSRLGKVTLSHEDSRPLS